MERNFSSIWGARFLSLLAIVALAACSSSPKSEDEIPFDDGGMFADAETDSVPQSDPEMTGFDSAHDSFDSAPPAIAEDPVPPAMQTAQDYSEPRYEEPSPTYQPAPAPSRSFPSSADTTDYVVQRGDTLMKIAFETYGDLYRWKDVYEGNRDRIPDVNALVAGTVLKLERPSMSVVIERNGEKYLIKRGDTLGTISQDVYGTTSRWKELWHNNRQLIRDPNRIFAGFYLYYVPDHGQPSPQVAPQPLVRDEPVPSYSDAGAREPAADTSFDSDGGFGSPSFE